MVPDRLDETLTALCRPEAASVDLATRVLDAARTRRDVLARFERALAVDASPRGVRAVRPGKQATSLDRTVRRLVAQARGELGEYFAGERVRFAVPVDVSGCGAFQRRVLAAAATIPFGETRAYGWVAEHIGSDRAVRAVGTALGRNPVPIIVPCHRVLRTGGALGGYAFGLPVKEELLALERATPLLVGCASTKILCRTGCSHVRRMRSDRQIVFASVADARSVGYRPCRVCRPA